MTTTATTAIDARTSAVEAAMSGLAGPGLLPGERMILSGGVFGEAPALVLLVAEALGERPDLFSDLPVGGADLRARQERALAYRCLRDTLLVHAARAGDLALAEQAAALDQAMAVVRQVRQDGERPFPHPRAEERAEALQPAEQLLSDRQSRKARARRDAQEAASPEAAVEARRPPPQREAVRAARKKWAREGVLEQAAPMLGAAGPAAAAPVGAKGPPAAAPKGPARGPVAREGLHREDAGAPAQGTTVTAPAVPSDRPGLRFLDETAPRYYFLQYQRSSPPGAEEADRDEGIRDEEVSDAPEGGRHGHADDPHSQGAEDDG